jgi:hypothetical protein
MNLIYIHEFNSFVLIFFFIKYRMPECPVCLQTKCHRSLLKMPCHHYICMDCASKWLPSHPSCPLCREKNDCFSLSTRSKTKASALLVILQIYINDVDFDNFIVEDFIDFLATFIIPFRHYWYRPRMRVLMLQLQKVVEKNIDAMSQSLNVEQKSTLLHFLRI